MFWPSGYPAIRSADEDRVLPPSKIPTPVPTVLEGAPDRDGERGKGIGELDIALPAGRFQRFADGMMRTTLADGSEVMAVAGGSVTDVARAESLGYGGDTDRMSLDHELVHLLLASWLGLPEPARILRLPCRGWLEPMD